MPLPSQLNPYAQGFKPEYSDDRCLFLTFSNGFPLHESQISNFFNWMYPSYVEKVYVHRPRARGEPSLFGKVMFTTRLIPGLMLGKYEKVCVCIDGLPVYCRRFVSKKSKTPTIGNNDATSASNSLGDGGSRHGGDE